jgi:predicted Zn finger-like uncharacterized protein
MIERTGADGMRESMDGKTKAVNGLRPMARLLITRGAKMPPSPVRPLAVDRSAPAMILTCPSCAKRFMLDARLLGAGRKVKCGHCAQIWFAEPKDDTPLPPRRRQAAPGQPARQREAAAAASAPPRNKAPASVASVPKTPARAPAKPPPPATNPPIMESEAATIFDDPPDFDPIFGDGGIEPGAPAKRDIFGGPAMDDMPIRPRPLPPGSNLPTMPGKHRKLKAEVASWALLLAVMAACGAGLFYGRDRIIAAWPPAFRLYELAGLAALPGVGLSEPGDPKATKVEIRDVEGINLLFITGEIANRSGTQRDVPDIQAVAYGTDGQELFSWRIVPPVRRLFPHQTTKFESRMPEREGMQAKRIGFRYVAAESASSH